MKRMAIGAVVGLATWFGSALAAEAQQIMPTGPLSITAGQQSCNYTATISLPTPANFLVRVWVYRGTAMLSSSTTIISNPYTNTYYFSKSFDMAQWNVQAGDSLKFVATLTVLGKTYNANDWTVVVSGTRPSSKVTSSQKSMALAYAGRTGDRRKE